MILQTRRNALATPLRREMLGTALPWSSVELHEQAVEPAQDLRMVLATHISIYE